VSKYCARLALLLLGAIVGCGRSADIVGGSQNAPVTLTVGFGLPTDESSAAGMVDTVSSLTLERLVAFFNDARPQARLAERWLISDDGLSLKLWLQSAATFHDGQPVTAIAVRDSLAKRLPASLGSIFEDVREIRATGDHEIELTLNRPSRFVFEGLEIPVQPAGQSLGTAAFYLVDRQDDIVELRAYDRYYGGRPAIDRILFRSYDSVRAAWADMLRGQVDMLYEVGADALASIQPSTQTRVFSFDRPYQYMVILNVQKPGLRDPSFRRALNASINRRGLVDQILEGHGTESGGPVSPKHWAYSADMPVVRYEPRLIAKGSDRPRFTCIVADQSTERVALFVQRELQAVGIDLELQPLPIDVGMARVEAGDFDMFLADANAGPTMIRYYRMWRSGEQYNWGRYSSDRVDSAMAAMRHAPDDEAYKAAVAAFQAAIINDPPAIFLAWSKRARAVSTRFEVPVEPDRDILSDLRLWRPAGVPQAANRN
jgi:peptide/nickel transport system substrate-binding protein